tara:strand:- start:199 stop:795 length:597 start_codon:yes stop_codon:yes gene_type:complete
MSLGILSLLFLFLGDNDNVNSPGEGLAQMDDTGFDIEQQQLREKAKEEEERKRKLREGMEQELKRQRDALKHIAVAATAHDKYEQGMLSLANILMTNLNGSYWDTVATQAARGAQEYQTALERSGAKDQHAEHDRTMRQLAKEAKKLKTTLNGKYWTSTHGGKKLKYRRRKTKKMGNRKHKKTMRRKGKRRNRRTKKR